MSRREVPYAQGLFEDMEIHPADGYSRQDRSLQRRWSESDDEYFERMHNGNPRPAESRQNGMNQATTWVPGYSTNEYGEPYLPPPPYHERDDDLGEGEMLPNHLFNMYPNGGRQPDYVTNSSGRRERYIIDGRGERVAWPLPDHVDTSDDDEDSDMVRLKSGRVIPRSEWEADQEWEYSSEEPSDDIDEEFFQRRRSQMPQTRNSAYATLERERRDREIASIRSGHSAGARRGHRESNPGFRGQSHHLVQERPRYRHRRPGRSSGHH